MSYLGIFFVEWFEIYAISAHVKLTLQNEGHIVNRPVRHLKFASSFDQKLQAMYELVSSGYHPFN